MNDVLPSNKKLFAQLFRNRAATTGYPDRQACSAVLGALRGRTRGAGSFGLAPDRSYCTRTLSAETVSLDDRQQSATSVVDKTKESIHSGPLKLVGRIMTQRNMYSIKSSIKLGIMNFQHDVKRNL